MKGKLIEGVWDCVYCGTKKIRGSIRECPQCGHPRDEDIQFYLDNPTNCVEDSIANKINRNPDWVCPYCDCLNSDNDSICKGCGASRDGSKDYFQNKAEKERNSNSLKRTAEKLQDVSQEYKSTNKTVQSKPKRNLSWIKWVAIGLGIAAIIVTLLCIFLPKTVEGTVTDVYWKSYVDIEEYTTVQESDWSIPIGGRLLYSRSEIRSYDHILDHYETRTRSVQVLDHYEEYVSGYRDLGNGHFEEIISRRPVYTTKTETYQEPVYKDVPIYDTKYYYEIERWLHQSYKTESNHNKSPYYADYTPQNKEREAGRWTEYFVVITDNKEKERTLSLSEEDWNKIETNQKVRLKVFANGKAEIAE